VVPMRALVPSLILIPWAACCYPSLSEGKPQQRVEAKLANDVQLRSVLLQARDAVVAETRIPDSGYATRIETDVERVTRYLLMAGNRADVLYLQEHVGPYAEKIRGVLLPAETLADFAARAEAAEQEDKYRHDEDIELIVEQEIQNGFLEDALRNAMRMQLRLLQARTMAGVALSALSRGNSHVAASAVEAALEKKAPNQPWPETFFDHQRMLLELAQTWFEGDYKSAALMARREAKKLLEQDNSGYQGYWRDLGQEAAREGDIGMAADTLEHLTDPNDRLGVQTEMQRAQAKMVSPAKALEIATRMEPGYVQFETLRDIAVRQMGAGDKVGASRTLEKALQVGNQDYNFRVMRMADIAWEQARMGDKAAAEATIARGLKDNEGVRFGSDQVGGWMMLAQSLAYMGEYDRAVEVALKSLPGDTGADALRWVAYDETQDGHGDWAMRWAEKIEDPEGRASASVGIAAGLIEQITGRKEDVR